MAKSVERGALPTLKSMSLSLRLLKQGRAVEDAFRDESEMDEIDAEIGRLFTGQGPAVPPSWNSFIGQFARGGEPRLRNQSCGAVIFLEVEDDRAPKLKRTMALSFGTGHHALDPDAFERGFGLRVVLNAVTRKNLRGIDVATLDATTFLKRVQASRDADLDGFKIDIDRDLVRLAAGSPKDATFARSLAGKDALHLNGRTSANDIIAKCKKALTLYTAQDYKRDYAFIDFVTPVRDNALVDALDALAFSEIVNMTKGAPSDLHIALPDILDPEESISIGYFGVGLRSGSKPEYAEVAIEDYIYELGAGRTQDITDMATLRSSHEVRVMADGEGDKRRKRKVYECLVYEAEYNGDLYVLFGGEWFAVERAFYAAVEAGFVAIAAATPFVAFTTAESEREFIAELEVQADLLNMDQVKLNPLGTSNANLEPCDFLSRNKQFIHLKDGHSSAPISHLWNQGLVSAECFVRDEKFRKDLRDAAIKRQKKFKKAGFEKLLPDGRSRPIPSEYTVVFGIMRSPYKKSGSLSVPFFSKVSLRAIADRVRLMGFGVEVHLVEKRRTIKARKKAA